MAMGLVAKRRALLSWSSGKDSAWALHTMRQQDEVEVVGRIVTFNGSVQRVSSHGVRRELVEMQAARLGLPIWPVELPYPCPNDFYEQQMDAVWRRAVAEGSNCAAFGDLFLEDICNYCVQQMRGSGIEPLFPIWGIPTDALARAMIAAGARAKLTCVDPRLLDARFIGREFDAELLAELPPAVDPCGERGEFHSFCYAGPLFAEPSPVKTGEIVERDGHCFIDVLPGSA